MKKLLVPLVALALTGCASLPEPSLTKLAPINPAQKDITILTHSKHNTNLRLALLKAGFDVHVATTETVTAEHKKEASIVTGIPDVSYGLNITYFRYDRCLANQHEALAATVEVVDLKKNKPVLILERNGWTGDCGSFFKESLLTDIAEGLANNWN